MEKLKKVLSSIVEIISGKIPEWGIIVLMLLVIVEVVTRYVFSQPLGISDEMGAYMLVGLTFLALAYTWKEKGHVAIDVVVSHLPVRTRRWFRVVTLVIAVVFTAILVWGTFAMLFYSYAHMHRSSTWLRTPLYLPQIAMPIGSTMLLVQMLLELIQAVQDLRKPEDRKEAERLIVVR